MSYHQGCTSPGLLIGEMCDPKGFRVVYERLILETIWLYLQCYINDINDTTTVYCCGLFDILRPIWNSHRFVDVMFKCMFMNQHVCILNSKPKMQSWFRQWLGAEQAESYRITYDGFVYWLLYASFGLYDLHKLHSNYRASNYPILN